METKKLGNTVATIDVDRNELRTRRSRTRPSCSPRARRACRCCRRAARRERARASASAATRRSRSRTTPSSTSTACAPTTAARAPARHRVVAPRRHRPELHRARGDPEGRRGRDALRHRGGERRHPDLHKKGDAGPARAGRRPLALAIAYPDRVAPNAGFARTQAQADTLGRLFGLTLQPFQPFEYNVTKQLWETGYNNTVNGIGERRRGEDQLLRERPLRVRGRAVHVEKIAGTEHSRTTPRRTC